MYFIKSLLCSIPVGIALTLELAISNSTASPIMPQYFSVSQFTPGKSPLIPLKKRETKPFLVPLKKGGVWGDQTEKYQLPPTILAAELDTHTQLQALKVKDTQLKQRNPPPPPDENPNSSAAGGRRAPTACPQDEAATTNPPLTAFSPTTKPGLTLAERPTFLVYVPKTSAEKAEFSLASRDGRGVYRTTVALTNTPDIISITLPAQGPPLEVGKQYTWSVAIICNPNDRVDDQFVTGTVQRTELDPTRWSKIQQAPPKERVTLYQKADAWYDALAILFELQRSQPNDPSISATWHEFLQSGGVSTMIDTKIK
jgi:hypothetical protein